MPLYGQNYGIGKMLGGLPMAIQQGKQMGMQMQQQQLTLEEQQRKAQEAEAINEAMAAQPAQGGLGYTNEEDPVNQSPYLQRAKLLEYRAGLLEKKGMGMPANMLRQQAEDAMRGHTGWAGQRAAQSIMSGALEPAKRYLAALGMPVESIAADGEDDRFLVVTSGGVSQRIPREEIALAASGEKNAYSAISKFNQEWGKIGQRAKAVETKAATKEKEIEAKKEIEANKITFQMAKLKLQQENRKAAGGSGKPKVTGNVDTQYFRELLNRGVDLNEARRMTYEFQAGLRTANQGTPRERAIKAVVDLEKKWGATKDPAAREQKIKEFEDAFKQDSDKANTGSGEPAPMPRSKRPGNVKYKTAVRNGKTYYEHPDGNYYLAPPK